MVNHVLTILVLIIFSFGASAQPNDEYYENGQLKHSGELNNGKKNGEWNFYYPSGIKEATEHYKLGELHGEAINFDFNGNKIAIEQWNNGNLEDSAIYFYPNGVIEIKLI